MSKRITASTFAALALSLFAVSGPASAAPRNHRKSTVGATAHLAVARPSAVATTASGAGYFAYPGDGNDTRVGATFRAPAITCASASDFEWLLPGIWIYDDNSNLVQEIDVNLDCDNGEQLRESEICVDGSACDTSLTINPGDVVEVSWSNGPGSSLGTVRDRTQHTVASVSGPKQTNDFTVFVGDEGPTAFGVTAVPTFTKVSFSNVSVNGQYLGDWSPLRYNLKTASTTQIAAGAISSGLNFTTTFKHNN